MIVSFRLCFFESAHGEDQPMAAEAVPRSGNVRPWDLGTVGDWFVFGA